MAREAPQNRINRAKQLDEKHENTQTSEKTRVQMEQFGVRLPKELIDRLRITAATRKAKGTEPQTQADIAKCALNEWLDRNEK